jgi:hypothetical protein
LEYLFFFEILRFEKLIALSEKKPPLTLFLLAMGGISPYMSVT